MKLKNKVVLITGASYGIGKTAAELFYKEGAKVALAARSVDKLNDISKDMKDSFVIPVDMTNYEQVRNMVQRTYEHYGRIDVLINNAGQGQYSSVENINIKDMNYIMSLNVYGPIVAMQTVIPIMRKQGGGTIVNVSSMVSKNTFLNLAPYAATKTALNMISLTARKELEKDGIVVSLVHPKLTATDFSKNALKNNLNTPFHTQMPQADPVEMVSDKILEAVLTGKDETIVN